MGLPGHRRTSSHKHRRASHFALEKTALNKCSHCNATAVPHRVCGNCGYYRGREIIAIPLKRKK